MMKKRDVDFDIRYFQSEKEGKVLSFLVKEFVKAVTKHAVILFRTLIVYPIAIIAHFFNIDILTVKNIYFAVEALVVAVIMLLVSLLLSPIAIFVRICKFILNTIKNSLKTVKEEMPKTVCKETNEETIE